MVRRPTRQSVLLLLAPRVPRVVRQVFELVRLAAVVRVRHARAGHRRLGHRVDGLVDVAPPARAAAAVARAARRPVELTEAALRTEAAQQRLEEERRVRPADGHDDHEEGAELAVCEHGRRHHQRARQERRQRRDGHGTAHARRGARDAHLPVEVRRQAVGHAVVQREVYRQADGRRDRHRLEHVELPAEQHERGDRDEDGGGDAEHGVEGDEQVERRQEGDDRRDGDGDADGQRRALGDARLQRVEVEQADEPAVAHLVRRRQHALRHPVVHVAVEGGDLLVAQRVRLLAVELDDQRHQSARVLREARPGVRVGAVEPARVRQYRHVHSQAAVEHVLAVRELVETAARLLRGAGRRVAAGLHEQLEVLDEAVRQLQARLALVEVRGARGPAEAQQPALGARRRRVERVVVHDAALAERVEFVAGVDGLHAPHDRDGHRAEAGADAAFEVPLHAQVEHLEQVVGGEQLEVVGRRQAQSRRVEDDDDGAESEAGERQQPGDAQPQYGARQELLEGGAPQLARTLVRRVRQLARVVGRAVLAVVELGAVAQAAVGQPLLVDDERRRQPRDDDDEVDDDGRAGEHGEARERRDVAHVARVEGGGRRQARHED